MWTLPLLKICYTCRGKLWHRKRKSMPAHERSKQNKKKSENLTIIMITLYILFLRLFFPPSSSSCSSSSSICGRQNPKQVHLKKVLAQVKNLCTFLATESSDESSLIFTFPTVVFGQIRLTKNIYVKIFYTLCRKLWHLKNILQDVEYSTLDVEFCDGRTNRLTDLPTDRHYYP